MQCMIYKKAIKYIGGLAYVLQKPITNSGEPGNKHIFEGMGLNLSKQ